MRYMSPDASCINVYATILNHLEAQVKAGLMVHPVGVLTACGDVIIALTETTLDEEGNKYLLEAAQFILSTAYQRLEGSASAEETTNL